MKAFLLSLLAVLFLGCDGGKLTGLQSAEATPVPTPMPATPKPTPKPGEWRIKEYKNPLDKPRK